MKRNRVQDLTLIKKFLKIHTQHRSETATLTTGIKCTYVCRVQNHEGEEVKVNFWIDETNLVYGIVGFGIISSVEIDSLVLVDDFYYLDKKTQEETTPKVGELYFLETSKGGSSEHTRTIGRLVSFSYDGTMKDMNMRVTVNTYPDLEKNSVTIGNITMNSTESFSPIFKIEK